MALNSSPLPIRHANSLPRTPSVARITVHSDDTDELAGDTIPCSPAAFLRDTTQPTQILSKPTLGPMRSSSPASSVIEVPASSPFQPPPKKTAPFVTRLAPAGSFFRPPTRPTTMKRPAPEPITISDDEDDFTPTRGDIRPTTFKAHIASFAYNQEEEERKVRQRLRQIFDVFGPKIPAAKAREALRLCHNDLNDTIEWLEKWDRSCKNPEPAPKSKTQRKLVNKGALRSTSSLNKSTSRDSTRTVSPGPPQKPRRRLVQGRRHQSSSQESLPSISHLAAAPSSDDPLIIDLVNNDKEDAFLVESSPSPDREVEDRVLTCINTSTIQELAAMTGMKEAQLEIMIEKRPFVDLARARKVATAKKPGGRKAVKVSIGENVVELVEVFLDAVAAIDQVVAQCEADAKAVKSQVDTWDLDTFGHDKRKKRESSGSEDDLPPTPTSLTSTKLVRPPVPRQPKFLDGHCEMKPFQLFGLNWMSLLYKFSIGCILADEMGLGKTCQVISFISHLVETFEAKPTGMRPWPNLIVVPPSTYKNWLAEFKRFAPGISVIGYRGSQSERGEIAYDIQRQPEAYHVVLATYSQINSETDIEAMQSFDLNAAIFDEGHKMKNPETKIYKDLRRITSSWKMLLTGTPVQNNLMEMTSLLNFINPEMFTSCMEQIRYIFSQKVTIRDVTNGAFLYSERVKRARTILEPFILQRRKDQVLTDMPKKVCNVVHCDMSAGQKAVYNEYEELFRLEPSKRGSRARGRQNDLNNCWIQLRKAALHPLLFRRHFDDGKIEKMGQILMDNVPQSELHQPEIKHLVQELKNSSDLELHLWCRDYPSLLKEFDIPAGMKMDSGKVRKLLELVAEYQKNGDRVLVFSKFSRVIELLQEVLSLQDIDHRVLMGNTDVSERQSLIDEFNENPNIPVFLLTTGAGGTGINLTAANKVIIFDQSDNPQDDIQAENRAHRLGQKRDVEIIRLIASHTIEELIYKACQKKIELANKVTGAFDDVGQNLETEVRRMMEEQMTPP